MKQVVSRIKQWIRALQHVGKTTQNNGDFYRPVYRVARIEKTDTGEYSIVIQMIGKAMGYRIKPEKLLADDAMVDLFSPRDIRSLTYLGHLGINAPKYKILAQQLSEEKDQTIFALHKKGDKNHSVVTAQEISSNEEILKNLSQKEAHMIGFAAATEQMAIEKQQKDALLKQLQADETNIIDQQQK